MAAVKREPNPVRIQRRRTRGWRMPDGAVYVGRPSMYGNPWTVADCGSPEEAVRRYRRWLDIDPHFRDVVVPHNLRGRTLACWCPYAQACHADVLLEVANRKD